MRNKEEAKAADVWTLGTRQMIYGAIGAVLYGTLSWITNVLTGSVVFRPAVAVLIFLGVAYGPWAGLLAGFAGDTFANLVSGYGFIWNWSLGNALMGMIAGLAMTRLKDFRAFADILKAVGWGVLGIVAGLLFFAFTEMLFSGIDLRTAFLDYFRPAFLGSFGVTVVLLPILMIVFGIIRARRSR